MAALPLRPMRVRGVLSAGGLCGGTWTPGGAFLLDERTDVPRVLDVLATEIRTLPWELVWFQDVELDSSRWRAFREALHRNGIPSDADREWQIGRVKIDHDWNAYQMRWSAKHRYNMRRGARRLSEASIRLALYSDVQTQDVAPLIRLALELEDRSWKGEARTSILARGLTQYITRQAEQLARWHQLEIAFLESDQGPVAFSYGCRSKGVHHTFKIGYDPGSPFSYLSPGKILWYWLIERLFHDPQCRELNFFGRVTDAISRWAPGTSWMGRLVAAPRRPLGRVVLWTYRYWKALRRRRQQQAQSPSEQAESPYSRDGASPGCGSPAVGDRS